TLASGGTQRNAFFDGPAIFQSGNPGEVILWDLGAQAERSADLVVCRGHGGKVIRTVLSADGKTLVSAATDATVRLSEAPPGRARRALAAPFGTRARFGGFPRALAVSPAGCCVATVRGPESGETPPKAMTVVVWDARTGERGRELTGFPGPQPIATVTFSPD